MRGWKFTLTEEDNVHVERLGLLTGSAIYCPGHPGSYWQPPDPPELEGCEDLRADGAPIPDVAWDDPDLYDRLLDAVWPVVERMFYSNQEYDHE